MNIYNDPSYFWFPENPVNTEVKNNGDDVIVSENSGSHGGAVTSSQENLEDVDIDEEFDFSDEDWW